MPATVYSIRDNLPIDLRTLPGITVLITVPAAFSGTCTNVCVPDIVQNAPRLKEEGADLILIVSSDQPHAIKKWVEEARWNTDKIAFASDFGSFEMTKLIGKISDEKGKENLPPVLGQLLRRSYNVVKDGKILWQQISEDAGKHTLNMDDMLEAVKKARQGS